jgi:glutamyl-tRNA synthetase
MNKKVKVRFAPSPTGALHIGGIRTALFNYLFAKKHGGEFLLRIEDTDQHRFVAGAEKYIIDSLSWLGIVPDDGINPDGTAKYRQSEREYRSFAQKLIDSGHAYYAFDSSEKIEAMKKSFEAAGVSNPGYTNATRGVMENSFTLSKEDVYKRLADGVPYVIRFNTPADKVIEFNDSVKGLITFNSSSMDDKVLFKSDGLPTYHLANVVDDHLIEITHVIRGDEWLPSTSLHIMLYDAFGWDKPEFCHLPLILGPDGSKLSKRHGDKYGFPVFPMTWDYVNEKNESVHITGFKDENYEPDALINFLALIGWNPGGDKEFMSMDEMIDLFSLDRINNSGGMFDIEKLKNFNAHYLRNNRSSNDLFVRNIMPHIKEVIKTYTESEIDKIVKIASNRSVFRNDLYKSVSYFFEPVVLSDDVVLKNESEFRNVMTLFLVNPCNRVIWTEYEIEKVLKNLCENIYNIKIGKVLPDLRLALTGGLPGPELPLVMLILGPQESCNRIDDLLLKTKKVAS